MDFFINHSKYERWFHQDGGFNISCLGYNDFSVIKPSYIFRIQNFYTWHFIISGQGTLEICDKKYHLKAGDMFFIPPYIKMRYYPDPDNPWKYVWFELKGDIVKQHGEHVGFNLQSFVKENIHFEKTNIILSKTFERLDKNRIGYFGILSTFYNILDVCTIHSSNNDIPAVTDIIDESFTSPSFSIETLCCNIGISHSHLLRLFKKEHNITIIQYIISKRIAFACELLRTTDLSISEVGFSSGFSDDIHFMKTFKKTMKLTPLNYRRQFKN